MKEIKFWHIDAFAKTAFSGNPAVVCLLEEPLEPSLMQSIAMEMNQSETAFITLDPNDNPLIRWFTPTLEIDLCGHATLASSFVYFSAVKPEASSVTFRSMFKGPLSVTKKDSELTLNFPSQPATDLSLDAVPSYVLDSLSKKRPTQVLKERDLLLVYEHEDDVRAMNPDFSLLSQYTDSVIVTAPSSDPQFQFISRFFGPAIGILEDPVTGAAHCTLVPYWANRLKTNTMRAYQASKRGGVLSLELLGDRVAISGNAVKVSEGTLWV